MYSSTPARRHRFGSKTVLAGALATGLVLTGCQATEPEPADTVTAEQAQDHVLTYEGPWAKAGSEMTGVFGTITNHSDEEFTLTGAVTDAAGLVELHETISQDGQMVMREVDDGFTIAPGASLVLEPGGNHIMLMEMPTELLPGDLFDVTLEFASASGTTETLAITADVRDIAGGTEEYAHDHSHSHDHDHEEHDDH